MPSAGVAQPHSLQTPGPTLRDVEILGRRLNALEPEGLELLECLCFVSIFPLAPSLWLRPGRVEYAGRVRWKEALKTEGQALLSSFHQEADVKFLVFI